MTLTVPVLQRKQTLARTLTAETREKLLPYFVMPSKMSVLVMSRTLLLTLTRTSVLLSLLKFYRSRPVILFTLKRNGLMNMEFLRVGDRRRILLVCLVSRRSVRRLVIFILRTLILMRRVTVLPFSLRQSATLMKITSIISTVTRRTLLLGRRLILVLRPLLIIST